MLAPIWTRVDLQNEIARLRKVLEAIERISPLSTAGGIARDGLMTPQERRERARMMGHPLR